MKRISLLITLLTVFSLLLASCRSSEKEDKQTESKNVVTSAAQTADAMLMTLAVSTATRPGATTSPTTLPPTPSLLPTLTPLSGTPTLGQPSSGTGDVMDFVSDVTVPDGTVFAPEIPFVKTWRLKNIGTSTWTTAYSIVFTNGTQMGAPDSSPLPATVAPGGTVDISLTLTAPKDPGNYYAYFLLSNPSGQRFGIGGANGPFYVQIQVSESGGTQAPPVTPVVTTTPGAAGGTVNWVFLSVDSGSATGCPHTFKFTGQITLSSPAKVTYQLELIPAVPGPAITLPPAVTVDLPAGTHMLPFQVDIPSAFNGIARLHVTMPEDVPSNQVIIALVC